MIYPMMPERDMIDMYCNRGKPWYDVSSIPTNHGRYVWVEDIINNGSSWAEKNIPYWNGKKYVDYRNSTCIPIAPKTGLII